MNSFCSFTQGGTRYASLALGYHLSGLQPFRFESTHVGPRADARGFPSINEQSIMQPMNVVRQKSCLVAACFCLALVSDVEYKVLADPPPIPATASAPPAPDPRLGEVSLPAQNGWNVFLEPDDAPAGVGTVEALLVANPPLSG